MILRVLAEALAWAAIGVALIWLITMPPASQEPVVFVPHEAVIHR